ncbi:MAG TPA: hypothetical protein VFO55_14310 [Gemmatimonadaceae bacterium]|nr:hypothetical protein [Gemmatimonadaceae bacterium]
MRTLLILILTAGVAGCFDARRAAAEQCGTFGELCPVPVDSNLVEAITTAWLLEIDPMIPTSGTLMIGPGGDSAWTVAVYERLRAYRPDYFAPPADTLHAPHLSGITVQMLGDTAKVTTSISQCLTRQTTYNWREIGLAHKFVPYAGKWALLPGSLAHLANGKC